MTWIWGLTLTACLGPPAPDPAICRDYLHRLCIKDVCAQVAPLFASGTSCETQLQTRTGCDSEEFVFSSPTRERFLSCRLPLLRAGQDPQTHPSCDDVAESFDRCPDVVRMLQGIK